MKICKLVAILLVLCAFLTACGTDQGSDSAENTAVTAPVSAVDTVTSEEYEQEEAETYGTVTDEEYDPETIAAMTAAAEAIADEEYPLS